MLATRSGGKALVPKLTILGLQVTVQNRHGTRGNLGPARGIPLRETEHIRADLWRVNTIVTPVQGHGQLAEDAPDEAFLSSLALEREVLDHAAEIAVAAVLHVEVEVLADLEVLAVVVGDDVGMSEM